MSSKITLRHRYTVTAAVFAVIAIAVAGTLSAIGVDSTANAQQAPQAAGVDVAEVVSKQITDWQQYSGRLEAVDRVEIRPLVSGTLTAVHFKDGAMVKKGDVLFTIDPRPYAAEVARAQAQLAGAEARAAYTASDVARGQRLLGDNAIAKRDYEEKQNASREAAANVQAAQAALRSAKLNLEYTQIVAPVSGRMSRAEVTVGNIVSVGSATPSLSTLVSMSKIYASFDVDEQSFLKYVNPARAKGTSVAVFLGLANEDAYSREGKVGSIDNRVDTSSGTIRVRAVFDNADGQLLPGLYARIRLGGGAPRDALLVDEKALGTDQDKRFVLVLDKDNHATYREVRVGANQDGLRVIESGLKSGERIVVNGLQRVRPGDTVAPNLVPMVKVASAAGAPTPASAAVKTDKKA
ncbi:MULTISPECIES: efflux RND transporter periplasmic adaptor subunit [unclassified Herbaspirillum]|uniref:efflux RND transporter periplasmic adaptor subunit n=1 Tax=unclassified Herbaspirillum TaxID=2624150 RepID=UPI000E2E50EC|nr:MULTISPECIES: efflux RND transporter periplasmic adaptor subunit [unclassified Herbaspirillum]RFB67895.1 efflux RND transporter periplasmic adaptor subunit [Herbaspirillum sp. 3R-3a1]TFI06331.1 efflux RND transporter periplasmic adaptor subunit [Herbaspirillum sp. 3R11]TFI14057.1 efflux RND transporter periplasmic adaptor subunit [Herbaspirillum sp. 3R-11]TFI23957.1 efflux RND transporter periplasmic adaptor subunit [Herbaspirillum sp. 3C11]